MLSSVGMSYHFVGTRNYFVGKSYHFVGTSYYLVGTCHNPWEQVTNCGNMFSVGTGYFVTFLKQVNILWEPVIIC